MYIDIMDKFYQFLSLVDEKQYKVTNIRNIPIDMFPKPEYVHTRALLEARFHPRKFTLEEVKGLIEELFPRTEKDIIPKWYRDKWFK